MRSLAAIFLTFVLGTAWAAAPPVAVPDFKGEVLETMDVANYTYLRLKTPDGEAWAAVSRTEVPRGSEVTLYDPIRMTDFASKTLNRTFATIYFGSLTKPAPKVKPEDVKPPVAASKQADEPVGKIDKAAGADGYTVGEVATKRAELAGKTVSVRGKVVKFSPSIMGKNWVHLRDGTGAKADGSDDLLVTTQEMAKVGDVLVARGVVRVDVDFGMGYAYKVLIEDGKLSK
jgi:hypothetical protein